MSRIHNNLIHDSSELRQMILGNPTLSLVVLADGDTSCADDCRWWYQSDVRCLKGVILDCDLDWTDSNYIDEDDFKDDLMDYLYDEHDELGEVELEQLLNRQLEYYEPYWKEVIIVYVSN